MPLRLLMTVSLICAGFVILPRPAHAAERVFPFDRELRFDADPVRGSRKVPGLQFAENGKVEIDLWCATGMGQAVVTPDTVTIVPTTLRNDQCPADRLRMDEALLDKLTQVTAWRWEGSMFVLVGPDKLRFRPLSN